VNSQKQGAWTLGPSLALHEPAVLYFASEHADGRGRADIYRIDTNGYRIETRALRISAITAKPRQGVEEPSSDDGRS
jgi:hypothetical protein